MKKSIVVAVLALASVTLGHEAASALPLSSTTKASRPILNDQIVLVQAKKGGKGRVGKVGGKRPNVGRPSRPIAGKPGKPGRPSRPIAGKPGKPGKPGRPIGGRPGKPSHPIVGRPGRPGIGHVHDRWHGRYWSHGRWITGTIVAIGFLNAMAAGAYAPPPPGDGYCWFYTDLSYTTGYWALCP